MKLGIVVTHTDPETVYNVLRLALYSLKQGDEVNIFLSGKGVEIDKIVDSRFNVTELASNILDSGGKFHACTTCLEIRNSTSSAICPLSTLKTHYEIVRDSDRLITI